MLESGDIVGSYRIVGPARVGAGWWRVRRPGSEDLGDLLAWEPTVSGKQADHAAETLSRIQDPGVPSVLERLPELWVLDATPGLPLTELVAARAAGTVPLRPKNALALSVKLCKALLAGHHKGRYHGHLHPGLVWLSEDGGVHVWGHGLPDEPPPEWLAPERARGKPVAGATDQWSLAATTCALVTGRAPWVSDNPRAEAELGVATLAIGPVAQQWPELGRLMRKLLDPEPRARHASLHQVLGELEALLRRTDGTPDLPALVAAVQAAAEAEPAPSDADVAVFSEPVPAEEDEAPAPEDMATDTAAPERLPQPVPQESMAVVRPALSDPDIVPAALGPHDLVPSTPDLSDGDFPPSNGGLVEPPQPTDPDPPSMSDAPTTRRPFPPALMAAPTTDSDADAEPPSEPLPDGPAPAIGVPTPRLSSVPDPSDLVAGPSTQVDDPLDAPPKKSAQPMKTVVPRQVGLSETMIPIDTEADVDDATAVEVVYETDPAQGPSPDLPPPADEVEITDEALPDEPVGDPPAPLPGSEPHPVVKAVPWLIVAMLLLMAASLVW